MRNSKKILIIYYSYSGVTGAIAAKLRDLTGGDLFALETVNLYSQAEVLNQAKREVQENRLPQLKRMPGDLSAYDLILVGGPVWWYAVSAPVLAFLRRTDFAGKKVAAFCTHEGGLGDYFSHFKKEAGNAAVLEGLDLYSPGRSGDSAVEAALRAWLEKVLS